MGQTVHLILLDGQTYLSNNSTGEFPLAKEPIILKFPFFVSFMNESVLSMETFKDPFPKQAQAQFRGRRVFWGFHSTRANYTDYFLLNILTTIFKNRHKYVY